MTINYKSGYKYQLVATVIEKINIHPKVEVSNYFLRLTPSGVLTIMKGYAWDGPSGPTIDTKNFMRGSLIHDALYQMEREGLLPQSNRILADKELIRICKEDGMSSLRRWWVYLGVRFGGKGSAKRQKEIILTAP